VGVVSAHVDRSRALDAAGVAVSVFRSPARKAEGLPVEALSSAVHSWLQMFRGATETVEQSDRQMVTLRHEPRVSIPHRKIAVEASPILPLCLRCSKFYQSV